MNFKMRRTANYKPGLFWFCVFALIWATLLLYAGGFTTSIEAGMAFLDWPLSNGSINPEGWMENRMMRAEHSHRLLGMKIGLLSITLCIWMYICEERRWLRLLSGLTLAVIVGQGLLGGLRVLFDRLNIGSESNILAQMFAILHACGAQIVLCLLVTLAVASSRQWNSTEGGNNTPLKRTIKGLGVASCLLIFFQILIGAVMRHSNAGLAIITFPHSAPGGSWLPTYWNWAVTINFAHRIGAIAVTVLLLIYIAQIWASPAARRSLGALTPIPMVLLAAQIYLGAIVIWTRINEHAATIHLLLGAFLLASCWMLTFLSFRHFDEKRTLQLTV